MALSRSPKAFLEVHQSSRHFRGTTELEWMAWLRQVGSLTVRRSAPLAVALSEGSGALAIGWNSMVGDQPVPMVEVYGPSARDWFLLPLEPEAELDFTWRKGTALIDGTILTWSALPYWDDPGSGGAGGLHTVKRLHPAD